MKPPQPVRSALERPAKAGRSTPEAARRQIGPLGPDLPVNAECYPLDLMSPRARKLIDEAAALSPAERLVLIKELLASIDVTKDQKEQMDRQRRAILQFLALPTAQCGTPDASSNKYGLPRHDLGG